MNSKLEKIREDLLNEAINCRVISNVLLSDDEANLLYQLGCFAVMQVEDDVEFLKDPRKVFYKSDEELKIGLVALGLAVALTKHFSRKLYNKEFFEGNIKIDRQKSGEVKKIDFGNISRELLDDMLDENLIFDWMVYRDNKGRGIMGLADYKGIDLEDDTNFRRGGTPVYEFARFERKYYKYMRGKVSRQKDDMQDAFRRVFAEAVAKQLASQMDPVEFTAKLFSSQDPAKEIENMLKSMDHRSKGLKIEHKIK